MLLTRVRFPLGSRINDSGEAMKIACFDLSHIHRMHFEACKGKVSEDPVKRAFDHIRERADGFDVAVIACDAIVEDDTAGLKSATPFRSRIDPPRQDPEDPSRRIGYKANRESPGAAFYEQQSRLIRLLKASGYHIVVGPEVEPDLYAEADDVIGWVAANYSETARMDLELGGSKEDWSLQIVSGDYDMLSLIDDDLDIYVVSPQAGRANRRKDVIDNPKFGVPPEKIREFKALAGDASDEYTPFLPPLLPAGADGKRRRAPGIGPKTARDLILAYGDAMGAVTVAMADSPPAAIPAKLVSLLRSGGPEAVTKGLALATLRTDLDLDFAPILRGPGPIDKQALSPRQYTQPARSAADTPEHHPVAPQEPATTHVEAIVVPQQGSNKALARPGPVLGGVSPFAFQPRSIVDLEAMASVAFHSGCYTQFARVEQVMMCIVEAAERGISLGVALRNAYIVKGKLGWSASIIVGQVRRSGLAKVFRIVETTMDKAVLEYQHINDPKPILFAFTIEEARAAGWLRSGEKGDGKWITNPRTMLRWAAMREVARFAFPEVTSGMHTPDELRNGVDTEVEIGDDPDGAA